MNIFPYSHPPGTVDGSASRKEGPRATRFTRAGKKASENSQLPRECGSGGGGGGGDVRLPSLDQLSH